MIKHFLNIVCTLAIVQSMEAESVAPEPITPPVLNLVTVNHTEASATLNWTPVPSADLAGFVVYSFRNNEGYAIDTLRDPLITSYTDYATPALFYSETYVVAALDIEDNVSPLSNPVSTIFLNAEIDTCNLRINLNWNSFSTPATEVASYEILVSTGGPFGLAGTTLPGTTEFSITGFDHYAGYIFVVKAVLVNGDTSLSNRTSVTTDMPRPPSWIEVSNVTLNSSGMIVLDINYDPLSEISLFRIERKSETESSFVSIGSVNSAGGFLSYTDPTADSAKMHLYRVSAINSCNIESIISAEAGNIVIKVELADFVLNMRWNRYKGWPEGVNNYSLFLLTDGGVDDEIFIPATDSTFTISYRDLMYDLPEGYLCFSVIAQRAGATNLGIQSKSNTVCIDAIENIFVPNAFSPDNNGINDYWAPVLSFTPASYYLVVRSRIGKVLFESDSYLKTWDGTFNGDKQLPDVYLWYLKVKTSSDKIIEKTGTLLLIYNQYDSN